MITPTYIARFAAIDAGIASTAAAVAISRPSRCLSAGTQTVVFVVAVVRFHVLDVQFSILESSSEQQHLLLFVVS